MSFDAGAAVGRLELNAAGVEHGMIEATGMMHVFPSIVTEFMESPLLGFADLAKEAMDGVVEAFEHVAHAAHEVGVEAEKVGVSAEFLGGFGKAAQLVGGSMESLSGGIKFLGRNAAEAADGNKELTEAFKAVGLSADDVKGGMGDLQSLFMRVAQGINGLGTDAKKTQIEMALLGRGGIDLAGVIKHLGEVTQLQGTLGQLGATITEPMAEAGHKVGELGIIFDGFFEGMQNAVATPILQGFADNFDGVVADIEEASGALLPKLQGIGEAVAPYIMPTIDLLKDMGLGIADLIPDTGTLKSDAAALFSVVKGGADLLTGVVIPTMKLLEVILSPIGQLVGVITQGVGGLLQGIGGAGGSVANAVSGGGAPYAPTQINIGNVQFPKLDGDEASTTLANKLHGPLMRSIKEQRSDFESAAQRAETAAAL